MYHFIPSRWSWSKGRSADLPSCPSQRLLGKFLFSHLLRSPGVWQSQVMYPYLALAQTQALIQGLPPSGRHSCFWGNTHVLVRAHTQTHTLSGRGRLQIVCLGVIYLPGETVPPQCLRSACLHALIPLHTGSGPDRTSLQGTGDREASA